MHMAAGRPRGFWPRQAPYLIIVRLLPNDDVEKLDEIS